ncbi:MAG: DEAD/DEAH box helicase, partial [Myxococcales bacterium]|nr:DEAD/DEAH box helicase [Myxococcales bacterium]
FALLAEVPNLRAAGITVRMPPGWAHGRPPRVRVGAKVGGRSSGGLGFEALLDFDVALAIDGEPLTKAETKALLKGAAGLRWLRGRWIEVDPTHVAETLARYESVHALAAKGGLTFAEALRILARDQDESAADDEVTAQPWALASAGPWLAEVLGRLRSPEASRESDPGAALRAELRAYQRAGVAWLWTLWTLGTGGCLADDMGLGKTIQVIALLVRLANADAKRSRAAARPQHLVVAPASVLDNWARELARFAPSLHVAIAHRSSTAKLELADADVVLTTYGTLPKQPALLEQQWGVVVVDEAQAIKNPAAQQTRAVKRLQARMRLALTGTPVENRLTDLWSVLDFACPGLLGTAREFGAFTKSLDGRSFAPLRELCRPWILRRLKSDRRVITDLPDKTELDVACGLSKAQAALYTDAVESLARELGEASGLRRRGIVLAYLTRLKQICNHPSHWLSDGAWREADSGKLLRLCALAEEIAARQEKVLVFTQFREACDPLAAHLERVFGRPGLVLHGDVAVRKRAGLVEAFAQDDGPPFFVLSLRAGGTGLNLTAASHVIHFDRWWNPAVENQATDRAYRIGQHRNVLVHRLICRGTVEDRVAAMIVAKRALADDVLGNDAEIPLTELATDELLRLVRLDVRAAGAID